MGGIFFDYQDGRSPIYRGPDKDKVAAKYSDELAPIAPLGWEDLFQFAQNCGRAFLPAYAPIVEKRRNTEYGDRQRQFQLYRR